MPRKFKSRICNPVKNFVADYRGLSLQSEPRTAFIRSKAGAAIFVLLFPIFSFCLFGLIDRQPSPKEKVSLVETQQGFVQKTTTSNIGKHPGLTIGSPTELFPAGVPVVTWISILAGSLILAIVALILVIRASSEGRKSKLWAIFVPIFTYLVLITLLILLTLRYYQVINTSPISGLALIQTLLSSFKHVYLLVLTAIAQSVILGAVSVLYCQPLVPKYATTTELLDRHLKRAWKYTQLGMSVAVALAVGISLPIIVGKTGLTLLNTILFVGFLLCGASALVLFSALKIHYAGRYRREENLS
jgi:hypothetical protein